MNQSQAQLLADIATEIRSVPLLDFSKNPRTKGDCPTCFYSNAIKKGFDSLRDRSGVHEEAMSDFGVTDHEAFFILGCLYFGDEELSKIAEVGSPLKRTGEYHYQACKLVLERYGYGHLLSETKALSVKQILEDAMKVDIDDINVKQTVQ